MGFVNISDDSRVQTLVPWLQKLVDPLLKIKYSDRKVQIVDLDSSAPVYTLVTEGYNKCDCFLLCIPYALDTLRWPISFVWSKPNIFPIIGFDDADFKPKFSEIQALCEWDSTNPNAFVNLVDECLLKYKQFQISVCRNYERLAMELDNLSQTFDESKYDVLVERNDVIFVFPLTVEGVADLPKAYVEDIMDNRCTLKIKYKNMGGDSAVAEIMLSPFLNTLLSGKSCPKLPAFECFLAEYVMRVQEILNDAAASVYHEKPNETPFSEKFTWRTKFEGKSESQLAEEFQQFVNEIGAKFQKNSRVSGT